MPEKSLESSSMIRLLSALLIIGGGLTLSSCSADSSPRDQVPQPDHPSEGREASPADGDVAYAASELSKQLSDNDRLASIEVRGDEVIVIHWHGPSNRSLEHLIGQFPHVQIVVESTPCSPSRLEEQGRTLLATDPLVNIVGVAPDGSRLRVTLDPSAGVTSSTASLERKYSQLVGCPVEIEFGGVSPARP